METGLKPFLPEITLLKNIVEPRNVIVGYFDYGAGFFLWV
jgi:hypothetical protein